MIDEDKRALRLRILATRNAMSDTDRASKSHRACRSLNGMIDELAKNRRRPLTVAVYAAMNSEVDLSQTIAHLYTSGAQVAFPAMVHGTLNGQRMQMRAVSEPDFIARTVPFIERPVCPFESASPFPAERFPVVEPTRLDLLVVPLVAVDDVGMRLGYGGGCYDRYLPALSHACRVVGVAFADQRVPHVSADEHDMSWP